MNLYICTFFLKLPMYTMIAKWIPFFNFFFFKQLFFYNFYRRVADVVDSRMVFDGEQYEGNNRNALNRFQALRAASAVKILGKGVIKVVHRVDDAKENNNLGKKKRTGFMYFHGKIKPVNNFYVKMQFCSKSASWQK